ncbi:MAG: FAD-dependent monooxygenase [Caulobacteraceae bacterium]|nr:FAD-dependent monooxygenase [Caulobacteraceae bacterium]
MSAPAQVLIVGAGPVGLAAALFLTRRGVAVRILDALPVPVPTSKALGVNPRTLDLLDEAGVSARIETEAQTIHALCLHKEGRPLARIVPDWSALGADRPMVILPQGRTEALLTEALAALGVTPERGKALSGVSQTDDAVTATFADGEVVTAPLLFAADGAHSVVRHALNLAFPGDGWAEPWQLMDVDLTGPSPHEAYIDFRRHGAFVCLPFSGQTFRLIGFGGPLLDNLPAGWSAGTVHWQSAFKISHRMVERMSLGRIALAGDAAHIHSPIGARGMNLGIEDAFVFAACADDFLKGQTNRLEDYNRLRHPVDATVVKRVRALTSLVRNVSPAAYILKGVVPPIVSRLPFVFNAALKVGMGLDHPVALR